MTCMMTGYCGIWRITMVIIILGIAIFDLTADWIVFRTFYIHDRGASTTTALGVFCSIASLIFLLELRNAVEAFRIFRKHLMADMVGWKDGEVEEGEDNKRPKRVDPNTSEDEKSLMSWQESVSFMLLAWEDLPVVIILFVAFTDGPCELFDAVYRDKAIANLSLLGTFISALWKLMMSFFFCCYKCMTCQEMKCCRTETCCCFCRMFRPILAILLLAFTGYLYFQFNEQGKEVRDDCYPAQPNTVD